MTPNLQKRKFKYKKIQYLKMKEKELNNDLDMTFIQISPWLKYIRLVFLNYIWLLHSTLSNLVTIYRDSNQFFIIDFLLSHYYSILL